MAHLYAGQKLFIGNKCPVVYTDKYGMYMFVCINIHSIIVV